MYAITKHAQKEWHVSIDVNARRAEKKEKNQTNNNKKKHSPASIFSYVA